MVRRIWKVSGEEAKALRDLCRVWTSRMSSEECKLAGIVGCPWGSICTEPQGRIFRGVVIVTAISRLLSLSPSICNPTASSSWKNEAALLQSFVILYSLVTSPMVSSYMGNQQRDSTGDHLVLTVKPPKMPVVPFSQPLL